ncbi:hypothetical protein P691DRAFT_809200 [Macrolepiota fuliginosa MF-IS2]|uniref:VASt domain-containing protein n=1 Tax=Macrolepiota fuliginosa MF-IS2 TaxID=1400762 RepID=A0A9P6BZ41_9AGAR|nr:hypothetical protein P691DRAFT_809200 [Macrolepiota fuliginosa MF-IS2]
MAPGFLSKFVKTSSPTAHTRDRSSSPRTSTQRPRTSSSTKSTDAQPPKTPTQASPATAEMVTTPAITINTAAGTSKSSLDSVDSTTSSQPNVTVIPPSPLSSTRISFSSHSDYHTAENPDRPFSGVNSTDKDAGELTSLGGTRTTSVTASKFADDITPTPSPTIPTAPSPSTATSKLPKVGSRSRPVTPTSSPLPPTGNKQESGKTSSAMPKAPESTSNEVRHFASNRSLNVNVSHGRAATAPETSRDVGHGEIITMTPIVESPTGIRPPEFPSIQPPSTPEGAFRSPSLLPRDSDAVSLMSATTNGTTKEKKRPWKRSTTRKPTGLAGAIAASGMAMAQPTLSAAQQASFSSAVQSTNSLTPRKTSGPGSPPYSTRSPPGSSNHIKGRSADLSPNSTRSRRPESTRSGVRRTSLSVQSDNASDYHPEDKPDYYSGLEASSDDDASAESESILDEMEDIPVTGFAVASNKRNADFHELFPNIPEGDYLIEDYGCALQREILIQGRLYISENHVCFHANIFGWITDLSIPMYEITHLEKRMTAFVIPNAIQITTRQAKYTFASFLSRDTTYDVIYNIWRLARPDDGINSSRPSFDNASIGPAPIAAAQTADALIPVPKVTTCACGKEGHYSETMLDCELPGTPDRIHNLMFASGFIKEFMAVDQKLIDIQISDWQPTTPGSNLLTRNMSYIKPLNASVGPKSTKCEIKDEMVYNDSEQYITTVTTTRTPDVPSGGVFSVKTRTCLMWASSISTRLLVTTQVEWTGRSFIRSIIEKSAIDGQRTYHTELETAMRKYIQEHQSEFVPEGVAAIPVVISGPHLGVSTPTLAERLTSEEEHKRREQERNQRGLQWAWDTFEGASQVAIRSTKDALELIRDAWEQSSSTTIMWFVIVGLVMSNLWSLILMGSREEAGRRKEMRKMEDREKWVQGVVTALWDELGRHPKDGVIWSPGAAPASPVAWKKEVGEMQSVLDQLEERVRLMKESLKEVRVEKLDGLD